MNGLARERQLRERLRSDGGNTMYGFHTNAPATRKRPGAGHPEVTRMPEQDYKRCPLCGEEKPLTEFNRRRRSPDGYRSECRACQLEANRAWRKRNPEKLREQSRRKRSREPGQKTFESAREQALHPERVRARNRVHLALKRGDLIRPDACERCGAEAKVHAHHPDYSKPLEVEWLCPSCHAAHHLEAA